MALPILRILWAGNNSLHQDHLHVEGTPSRTGTPPLAKQNMTASVLTIYTALAVEFGQPAYFQDEMPPAPCWSHMGWYNRRKIAGSSVWSQHAWANALDIGPYDGVEEQQRFYDFLTGVSTPEPIPEDDLLPINTDSSSEDIRYLQRVIGVATSGTWDAVTVAAVKDLATRSGTGDPVGKAGTHVNGVMFDVAETEKILRIGGGGASGLQRGDTVKLT